VIALPHPSTSAAPRFTEAPEPVESPVRQHMAPRLAALRRTWAAAPWALKVTGTGSTDTSSLSVWDSSARSLS
jgi:hypothetical protein